MIFVVIGLVTIVFCEILLRMPFARALITFQVMVKKARSVIHSSRISDHWKERVIICYAGILFRETFRLLVCLTPFVLMLVVFGAVSSHFNKPFLYCVTDITMLSYVSILGIGYMIIRKKVLQ